MKKKIILLLAVLTSQVIAAQVTPVIDYASKDGYNIYGKNMTTSDIRIKFWSGWGVDRMPHKIVDVAKMDNNKIRDYALLTDGGDLYAPVLSFYKMLNGEERHLCDFPMTALQQTNYWKINIIGDADGYKENCGQVIKIEEKSVKPVTNTPYVVGKNMTDKNTRIVVAVTRPAECRTCSSRTEYVQQKIPAFGEFKFYIKFAQNLRYEHKIGFCDDNAGTLKWQQVRCDYNSHNCRQFRFDVKNGDGGFKAELKREGISTYW